MSYNKPKMPIPTNLNWTLPSVAFTINFTIYNNLMSTINELWLYKIVTLRQ